MTVLIVAAGVRLASLLVEPIMGGIVTLAVVVVILLIALGRGPRLPK